MRLSGYFASLSRAVLINFTALAFQLVFLIILISTFSFFPESPRWLAKVGRAEDARQVLAVIRTENGDLDDNKVNDEMFLVSQSIDKQVAS